MKMRLPANFSLFVVPAVCLVLLGAAWLLMRGGKESAEGGRPVLRLLCDQSQQSPVTAIVAAYERRGGVKVDVDFVPSSGLAGRLAEEPGFHLLLLAGGEGNAEELVAKGLIVAPESAAQATEHGSLRVFFVAGNPSPDLASGFVGFLSGPFARGILERHRAAGGTGIVREWACCATFLIAVTSDSRYSPCMSTPGSTLDPSTLPPFVDAAEGRLMMALKFFELGRLSLGQAAELADYTKRGFIDVLGHYGIPVVDYPEDELAAETAW